MNEATSDSGLRRRFIGLALGAVVFVVLLALPNPEDLSPEAWRVIAIGLLMAIWWVTEALPLSATALVPICLFPFLGVATLSKTTAPYAHPVLFLLLGGFIIALAMERWNLHRRIAFHILSLVGTRPAFLIAGFMGTTAFLSMWISNTATAAMMLPISLSIIATLCEKGGKDRELDGAFIVALLLGVAYGANIGGIGTLIGTAPNALFAAFLSQTYGVKVGFVQWMTVGVPLTVILLVVAWWTLTHLAFRVSHDPIAGADAVIRQELSALGPMNRGEKLTGVVFLTVVVLWVSRPVIDSVFPELSLTDTGVAIFGALLLFLLPVNLGKGEFVLDVTWVKRLPWEVLILFGGGLSLASAISHTGLAAAIGQGLAGIEALPTLLVIAGIVAVLIFLTELTSNTATTATFLPVVAGVAVGIGENPILLALPAAVAASCAFMMPVATPPNAIVFGSGKLTVPQMARTGFLLNLAGIVILTLFAYLVMVPIFGIEVGVLPEWVLPANPG
ncbi:MAG: DASS family sodium-coupled anion symporter [Alphaproteobacteria bacterium]|nr:DASS family sodium-coupled anion symporter [Alphaproteobacteria bacterium]